MLITENILNKIKTFINKNIKIINLYLNGDITSIDFYKLLDGDITLIDLGISQL